MTPTRDPTGHITENPMRYLSNNRINREDIRDYINSARKQLQGSLNLIEKEKAVYNLEKMYDAEKNQLFKARELFEDDY